LKGELKVIIVCSIQDRASQNIKNGLLSLRKWTPESSEDGLSVFEYKDFRIVEIVESLIFQDGLDKKIADRGYPASLIIFASKHRSKDMRAILTVHSTGNVNEAKFGGTPRKLSKAAPQAVRSLLRSLKTLTENEEYEVTLECTHHGPSEMDVPSVFIELGSNETQWLDEVAGRIVANAILLLKDDGSPVAVGFGGTHYAPRQTALILSTDVTFGHIFPTHALNEIDESMIRQAFARSGADFAFLDRKSMKGEERDNLVRMIESVGFEVLKESDIKEMDGIPWEFCMQLRKRVKEICPSGKPVITDGIKCAISSCQSCICPKVKIAKINPSLLCEAEKLDRNRLKSFISKHNIAYIEYEDGRFAHVLIGLDDSCARLAAQELNDECIEIIKQNYDVSLDKGALNIFEQKFSPKLAKSLGIEDEQLFGRLARGESVIINGKTINPEMVYETIKRIIKIN
jgi:D-aminoacyl-tRNA deacylase